MGAPARSSKSSLYTPRVDLAEGWVSPLWEEKHWIEGCSRKVPGGRVAISSYQNPKVQSHLAFMMFRLTVQTVHSRESLASRNVGVCRNKRKGYPDHRFQCRAG